MMGSDCLELFLSSLIGVHTGDSIVIAPSQTLTDEGKSSRIASVERIEFG